MKAGWIAIAAMVFAAPARGDVPSVQPPPPDPASIAGHNQQIVAKTPGTEGVFVVRGDGAIKHLQSGLICPASFPNATLFHLLVYRSAEKGADVGCDYGRPDGSGGAAAKLTIFATKAAPEMTLDAAFAAYRREVAQVWKDVRVLGPAIKIKDDAGTLPDFRSEEYLVTLNGHDSTSDLVVAISAGWVIEIRATFTGLPNQIALTKDAGSKEATLGVADRIMASTAFLAAAGTIGK